MHVPGYWRTRGWVRSHFKQPNEPGAEQLPLAEEEIEIPRPREPGPVRGEEREAVEH